MRPIEVSEAIAQLWGTTPIGSGAALNTLITYIERLERK